jgi:hypothetical protein
MTQKTIKRYQNHTITTPPITMASVALNRADFYLHLGSKTAIISILSYGALVPLKPVQKKAGLLGAHVEKRRFFEIKTGRVNLAKRREAQ